MSGGHRFALALSLCLAWACTGPGLEPPGDDRSGESVFVPNEGSAPAQMPGGDTTSGAPVAPTPATDAAAPMGTDAPMLDGDGEPSVDDDTDAGAEATGPGDALFQGIWAVEQPSHALYEATVYELLPNGNLVEHETVTLSDLGDDFVTGTVTEGPGGVECRFGDTWLTERPRRLVITAICSDDQDRDIALDFPDGDETIGVVPTVSVDGNTTWEHGGFPWSFRKCPSRTGCVLRF
ncbi:MAG: hypothetical protein OXT09_21705 [Myxococcales bacterium]|nr:hypothetical protein [Myxococcales bacterium]